MNQTRHNNKTFIHATLILSLLLGTQSNALAANSLPTTELAAPISMAMNPMLELDGQPRANIFKLRYQYVYQYPDLAPASYKLNSDIFSQIEDKKPWWGILGLSYYGPGQKGIEGPSEESRFLVNPYLLVGLDAPHAVICKGCPPPKPAYPFPQGMTWDKRNVARVNYDVSTFWSIMSQYGYGNGFAKQQLTLIAYNARDFGYNYLSVDPAQSSNIRPFGTMQQPAEIRQFIHTGGSCGYPGGCNNMSPHQEELELPIAKLPARAAIKLWKNRPANVQVPPDCLFIIDMR